MSEQASVKIILMEATAYHPTWSDTGSAENVMEGGAYDRREFPLMFRYRNKAGRELVARFTMEEFIAGRAPFVACAMDPYPRGPRYGTMLRCPELERTLNQGRPIPLLVVDTGGHFTGRGMGAIDVCCASDKWGCDKIGKRVLPFLVFANAGDPFMAGGKPL